MIRLLNTQDFYADSMDLVLDKVSEYFRTIPARIVSVETIYNQPQGEYPEVQIRVWWMPG